VGDFDAVTRSYDFRPGNSHHRVRSAPNARPPSTTVISLGFVIAQRLFSSTVIDTHGLVTLTHAGLPWHSGSSAILGGQPNYSVSPLRLYRLRSSWPAKPLVVQARIGLERIPPANCQHAGRRECCFPD